jgi:hypothetical protein
MLNQVQVLATKVSASPAVSKVAALRTHFVSPEKYSQFPSRSTWNWIQCKMELEREILLRFDSDNKSSACVNAFASHH